MKTFRHCHVSVDAAINNPKVFADCLRIDGVALRTTEDVKAFFEHHKQLGRKVVPMGDCDNFDYMTGCLGHAIESEESICG